MGKHRIRVKITAGGADARDLTAISISHLDRDMEHVDGLEVTPAPDLEPHPSLSAAERNPNLR